MWNQIFRSPSWTAIVYAIEMIVKTRFRINIDWQKKKQKKQNAKKLQIVASFLALPVRCTLARGDYLTPSDTLKAKIDIKVKENL